MTRRFSLTWPNHRLFTERDGRPFQLLALSDEADRTLEAERNRTALGPIDLVVGCGDLAPDWLCFVADAFGAPLVYVRGNHDRGGPWPSPPDVPSPSVALDDRSVPQLPLVALPWPSGDKGPALHDERGAWFQALPVLARRVFRRDQPCLVFSHVPPRDVGDTPADPYHRGFDAYRFLLDRLGAPLWLHGHTALAGRSAWHERHGPTEVVNVTGSVLVELVPPGGEVASPGGSALGPRRELQ